MKYLHGHLLLIEYRRVPPCNQIYIGHVLLSYYTTALLHLSDVMIPHQHAPAYLGSHPDEISAACHPPRPWFSSVATDSREQRHSEDTRQSYDHQNKLQSIHTYDHIIYRSPWPDSSTNQVIKYHILNNAVNARDHIHPSSRRMKAEISPRLLNEHCGYVNKKQISHNLPV